MARKPTDHLPKDHLQALTAGTADPEVVAEWAEGLTTAYLECRDYGHLWKPFAARQVGRGYERTMRCSRCKTEREQTLDRRGLVVSGQYKYRDGYVAPPGTGRLDGMARGSLRLESIHRLIEKGQ